MQLTKNQQKVWLIAKLIGYNLFMFNAFFQPTILVVLLIAMSHYGILNYPVTLPIGILYAGIIQIIWTTVVSLFLASLINPQPLNRIHSSDSKSEVSLRVN